MFKTTDEKLKEIGFIKKQENDFYISYERQNDKYIQCLDFLYKSDGFNIIQSYDKKDGHVVGLTIYEMKICIKKMKEKRW